MTKVSSSSRPLIMVLACSSTSAGSARSHARASMKNRTIDASAAFSTPFPATSPISIAISPLGSGQAP